MPIDDRGRLMHAVALRLRAQRDGLAALMTRDMGKPITQAEAEITKCADACDHFADHAAAALNIVPVKSDADESFIRFDPLGGVLAVMPWNFPFWQVVRFAAPALMAGNVGILKHAPNVPECAMTLESIFSKVGFPEGVFTNLFIETDAVEGVIRHPAVTAVTLTGSGRAGSAVAAQAGAALKKTVLELGGSDPFVVLPDADPIAAARAAAAARCVNSGQSCIAAKRFIVVGDNPAFQREFIAAMNGQRLGNPMSRDTDVGPLARLDLLESLENQVKRSVAAGAKILCGGERPTGKGFFYKPTVLGGVLPGMAAFDEELFGPVAALIRAKDVDDAVRLANASRFGLGASVWTCDLDAAKAIAARLEVGNVFINGPVKSDPRLPFGGVKQSGYGRELAAFGLHEFVNIKIVWVKQAARSA